MCLMILLIQSLLTRYPNMLLNLQNLFDRRGPRDHWLVTSQGKSLVPEDRGALEHSKLN